MKTMKKEANGFCTSCLQVAICKGKKLEYKGSSIKREAGRRLFNVFY